MATKCIYIPIAPSPPALIVTMAPQFGTGFPFKLFRLLREHAQAFNAKIHWNFAHNASGSDTGTWRCGGVKSGKNGRLSMQHLYAILFPHKKKKMYINAEQKYPFVN